jgi:hypothetical protein
VTIQQMTGGDKPAVLGMVRAGAPIELVASVRAGQDTTPLLDTSPGIRPEDAPDTFLIVRTCYDVSATAYFYLDSPENSLPALVPIAERCARPK